ncbi:MAG TPA: hypothetical protein VNE39_05105 [Planctomycetota bacterium]|nr:hypothetical protein [Planctomycetota bacterium]
MRTVATSLFLWLIACSATAAERVDYPPAARLKHQCLVVSIPEHGDRGGSPFARLIQRGFEAIWFTVASGSTPRATRWVVYDTAQRKIIPLSGEPEKPKAKSPKEEPPLPAGVKPSHFDRWRSGDRWRNAFKQAKLEDVLAQANLQEGFGCSARDGASANDAAQILLHRPPVGEGVKLCSLEPFEGQTLHIVYWLRLMPSGDVAVLAGNAKATVLQVYENPLLDTICAQWNTLLNEAFKAEPVVKAHCVGSLYDLSPYADRAFDAIPVASDGRAYFGTMPHHASESGPLFAFDPKQDKLVLLGDIGRLGGVHRPDAVPQMMHGNAFEMNGKVYFTGQDPHYGGWDFPVARPEDKPRYLGSPIVEFDLKTQKARALGVPFAGNPGIFRISGDPRRSVLYLRRGYHRGHEWPLTWFAIPLDARGNFAGEPKKFPLDDHPHDLLVAADGTIYCSVPEPKSYKVFLERRRQRQKTDDITPQTDVYRIAPDLAKAERITTLAGGWEIAFAPWQDGQPTAIGVTDREVVRLDLAKGTVEKIADCPKAFQAGHGTTLLRGNTLYTIRWVQPKGAGSRTSGLYSLDLATGKAFYHGVIVDDAGRRPKDLNHFAFLPDGRIFAEGTAYGLPTDRHYLPRYRDSEPYRLDGVGLVIEKLPPGQPADQP